MKFILIFLYITVLHAYKDYDYAQTGPQAPVIPNELLVPECKLGDELKICASCSCIDEFGTVGNCREIECEYYTGNSRDKRSVGEDPGELPEEDEDGLLPALEGGEDDDGEYPGDVGEITDSEEEENPDQDEGIATGESAEPIDESKDGEMTSPDEIEGEDQNQNTTPQQKGAKKPPKKRGTKVKKPQKKGAKKGPKAKGRKSKKPQKKGAKKGPKAKGAKKKPKAKNAKKRPQAKGSKNTKSKKHETSKSERRIFEDVLTHPDEIAPNSNHP